MAEINEIDCLQDTGNTGVGPCFLDYTNIVGAFLVPKGDEVDVTDLQTALIAKTHAANKADRWFPIYDFVNTTDNTEDKTVQQFNTGASAVVREGYNNWKFQYLAGGLSLLKNLRKMNGTSHDFIFFDNNMRLMGIPGSDATKIKGIPTSGGRFWAGPWKVNDGTKVSEYMVEFVFPVRYTNDYVVSVKADFDIPSTVNGLQDVELTSPTINVTGGSYNILARTTASLSNMGDRYSTELASAGDWVAADGTTGAAITVTAVTYNSTTKVFVVALDTADTDYPADGQPILINLADPETLAGDGIDGYESTGAVSVLATS